MAIKNIVFDVGNVLFRWDPVSVVLMTFSDVTDPYALAKSIFKHQTWFDLNLGRITEQQAIADYQVRFLSRVDELEVMMENVRASLVPLEESIALLKRLEGRYELFALTDNTKDIMAHLMQTHDFWPLFKGIVISAEVGHLKPSGAIYQYLLSTYEIKPEETVFIDDVLANVLGARKMGIKAIQFRNIDQCRADLRHLGIKII